MTTDPAADYAHGFEPPEMSLPEEARQRYIAGGGLQCPYCGSVELEGDSVQVDGGTVWQHITCLLCEQEWDDIYTLTSIDPGS